MDLVKFVEEQAIAKKDFPAFKSGDTVSVHYKIREGNKERVQILPRCCLYNVTAQVQTKLSLFVK